MNRLAVSSWSWHELYYQGEWTLLDLAGCAVSLGLNQVECNDFMLPPPRWSRLRRPLLALLPGCPPALWRYSRASLRRLRNAADAAGAQVVAWTVNSDFTVPIRQWPAQQLYLRRALSAAAMVGAPLLRVNLGGAPDTPAERDPILIHRLVRFARQAWRACSELSIAVENHWGISTDIARHLRLVDNAAERLSPAERRKFGCCFDPANMPDLQERDPRWRALAERAIHYHLKTTEPDDRERIANLPHGYLFQLLGEAGYTGPFTIEFAGQGAAEAGVAASVRLYERYFQEDLRGA